jgi:hypothetical protein
LLQARSGVPLQADTERIRMADIVEISDGAQVIVDRLARPYRSPDAS